MEKREKIEQVVKERERVRLDAIQKKWNKREEYEFLRVLTGYGVDLQAGAAVPTPDWQRFKAMAKLDKKSDETLSDYYKVFIAMCKRQAGVRLTEEEKGLEGIIDDISEDHARLVLDRLELLSKLKEVGKISSNDERLTLCQNNCDTPDWWESGKHDKELIRAVLKHGLYRSEQNIFTDPEFSFAQAEQQYVEMLEKQWIRAQEAIASETAIAKVESIKQEQTDYIVIDEDNVKEEPKPAETIEPIAKLDESVVSEEPNSPEKEKSKEKIKENVEIEDANAEEKSDAPVVEIENDKEKDDPTEIPNDEATEIEKSDESKMECEKPADDKVDADVVDINEVTPEQDQTGIEQKQIVKESAEKEIVEPTEPSVTVPDDEQMETNEENSNDKIEIAESEKKIDEEKTDEEKTDEGKLCADETEIENTETEKKTDEVIEDVKIESENKSDNENQEIPDDDKTEPITENIEKDAEPAIEDISEPIVDSKEIKVVSDEKEQDEIEIVAKVTEEEKETEILSDEIKQSDSSVESKVEPDVNTTECTKSEEPVVESVSPPSPSEKIEEKSEPIENETDKEVAIIATSMDVDDDDDVMIIGKGDPDDDDVMKEKEKAVEEECKKQAEELKARFPDLEVIQPLVKVKSTEELFEIKDIPMIKFENPIKIRWFHDFALEKRISHIIYCIEHLEWPVNKSYSAYTGCQGMDLDVPLYETVKHLPTTIDLVNRRSTTPDIITITTDQSVSKQLQQASVTPHTPALNQMPSIQIPNTGSGGGGKKRKRHIAIDVETERAKLHALLNSSQGQIAQSTPQTAAKMKQSNWPTEDEPKELKRSSSLQPPPAHQHQSQHQHQSRSNTNQQQATNYSNKPTVIPGTSSTLTPIDLSSR